MQWKEKTIGGSGMPATCKKMYKIENDYQLLRHFANKKFCLSKK